MLDVEHIIPDVGELHPGNIPYALPGDNGQQHRTLKVATVLKVKR
jgi:hypothetical protein